MTGFRTSWLKLLRRLIDRYQLRPLCPITIDCEFGFLEIQSLLWVRISMEGLSRDGKIQVRVLSLCLSPKSTVLPCSSCLSLTILMLFQYCTGFRSCFAQVLRGGSKPQNRLDSWDLSPRLNANSDLYNGAGQCSVFRMFQ